MSDTLTATDLLAVKVTDVAGNKVSHSLNVDGVISLDNARLVRRAVRAGVVRADDMEAAQQMHRDDRHAGLESRRTDMSRMRDSLATVSPLVRNGMLRALLKGV